MNREKMLEEEATMVVSATECTGLMPAFIPEDEEEDNIRSMAAVQKAKRKKK